MALTHIAATRNAMADAAVDLIDIGTTDLNGDLVLMTGGDVEVSILAMANPAYGNAAAGVAQENAITDDPSSAGGTIALFKLQNRDNAEVLRGTVTAVGGGGDIELTSLVIAVNEAVSITDLSYAAPV